jgi:hypothetical protein
MRTKVSVWVRQQVENVKLQNWNHERRENSMIYIRTCNVTESSPVIKEARTDILAIANLAVRCLRLNGNKRLTMKEVSTELEALRKVQRSLHIKLQPFFF